MFKSLVLKFLLIADYIAFAFFVCAQIHSVLVPKKSDMRVTELDRAEVFDCEKLKKWNPSLGENPRGTLGAWIAGEAEAAADRYAYWGIAITAINITGLHIALARRRKKGTTELPTEQERILARRRKQMKWLIVAAVAALGVAIAVLVWDQVFRPRPP